MRHDFVERTNRRSTATRAGTQTMRLEHELAIETTSGHFGTLHNRLGHF